MKPIIVAIDFSSTSVHSLEYAIPLANKFGANIIMVWVDKGSIQESLYPDTSNENRMEAMKRFKELTKTYQKELKKGLKFECKLRKGKVSQEIELQSKASGAGLIISGSHGVSGFEELMIGSNAFKMATWCTCPVITVRQNFPVKGKIRRIVIPIDNTIETIQKVPYTAMIAKTFKSDVRILALNSCTLHSLRKVVDKYAAMAAAYFEAMKIKHSVESLDSENIARATIHYAEKHKADLITIVKEKDTSSSSVLLGPYGALLINQSPIPVLSIHTIENFTLNEKQTLRNPFA